MKQTKLAFIIALGLVVPGLASAANFTGHGNTAYERDLTVWNGSDHDTHAARLAVQKRQFEYNSIYENDSAWNGFGYPLPKNTGGSDV